MGCWATATGTIPFSTQITAVLGSNYTDQHRRLAGRIDLRLADGTSYSYFRAGYTNLYPGECLYRTWTQAVPALSSLVGENVLVLRALDVTPSPYNQPPHAPSGGTDTDSCTVIGSAPSSPPSSWPSAPSPGRRPPACPSATWGRCRGWAR
jgi:hypothetical protein